MNLARLNHYRRSENWSLSAVPLLLMGCHTGPSRAAITLGKSASFRQVCVVRVPIVPTPGRHARNILPPNAIAINTPPKTDKAPPVFPGEPCLNTYGATVYGPAATILRAILPPGVVSSYQSIPPVPMSRK